MEAFALSLQGGVHPSPSLLYPTLHRLQGVAMALNDLQSLMVEQLRDLLSAEKQLVQALPKMAKAAQSPDLQQAFQDHWEATQNHVKRLEQAFEQINETARAKKCKGMEGLIEEGSEMIEEKGQPDVKDA